MTTYYKFPITFLFFLIFTLQSILAQDIKKEIKALKDTAQLKEGGDKVLALKDVGMRFRSVNMDSARYYMDMAFRQAEIMDDDHFRARIWVAYGVLSQDEGRPKEALDFHLKAKPILENSKDYYVLGSLYTNISNAYEALSEFDKAVDFQLKALENFKAGNDSLWIAGSYLNLGNRFKLIEEPDLSLEYYLKAMEMYKVMGNQYMLISSYNSAASAYIVKKEYDTAFEYAKKAFDGFGSMGARLDQAYPVTNMALASWGLENFEEAERYYIQAISLQEERGERLALYFLRNDLANVLLKQGKKIKAEELALTTYQEAEQIDFIPAIDVLSKTLSLIYEEKPDF